MSDEIRAKREELEQVRHEAGAATVNLIVIEETIAERQNYLVWLEAEIEKLKAEKVQLQTA